MAMTRITADDPYSDLLEQVDFAPVFIMGPHRSGTTLLYQVLQASGQFNVVNSYHVINYDEIVHNHLSHRENAAKEALESHFRQKGLDNRIIDDIKVGPDLPEEYGFILRNGSFKPHVDETSLAKFIELCKKVQLSSDPGRPLLLKNPRDFSHFRFLHQNFPSSKFIFVHRDPIQTINSHVRAIRAVFRSRSEYQAAINHSYRRMFDNPLRLFLGRMRISARLGLDLRRVRRDYERRVTRFLENIESLPRPAYCSVKYDDLCSRPASVVSEILEFLQLPTTQPGDYAALIRKRDVVLLDGVRREGPAIRKSLRAYYQYCGFDEA